MKKPNLGGSIAQKGENWVLNVEGIVLLQQCSDRLDDAVVAML
jgi:hypothetical protein